MTVNELRDKIKNTGYNFEVYHDFTGINDRYRENHNVLIKENVRLVATNRTRTKWTVFVTNNRNRSLKNIASGLSFDDAIRIGNELHIEELYDEFIETTADEEGEVDNNYFQIWLSERLSETKLQNKKENV